jgi:Fic family protein
VEFLIDKTRFLDRLSGMINARQQLAIVRMLREGPGGFEGGMSAGKYVVITKTSVATATRDLGELVEVGAVRRTGSNRSARYHLTIPLRPDLRVTIDQTGEIVES